MAEADLRAIAPAAEQGGAGEVFLAFLKLGTDLVRRPIAHLGYFRSAFVARAAG